MLNLKGTHGTCRTWADEISVQGFIHRGNGGRGGNGVYFWSYSQDDTNAALLAKCWAKDQFQKGRYKRAADSSCAIIFSQIDVNKDSYIDLLTDDDIRAAFITYSKLTFERIEKKYSTALALTRVHDLFVRHLEKIMDVTITVIRVALPPPTSYPIFIGLSGAPSCYVVKDVTQIKVERIEGC